MINLNNLLKDNKLLMKEYDFEQNSNIDINKITIGSNKKAWWKCEKGHEWQASIHHRNNGSGCPICSNRLALKGYNDLVTINPKLAKEWNYGKNCDLKPDMVTSESGKKVWWKCSKGHEWIAEIRARNRGVKCPYCHK